MTQTETLTIPDIGDFKDIPVIEVLVAPGDEVSEDETLVVLESDKATLDVPSPRAGRIKEIIVGPGDRVGEGSPYIVIEFANADAAESGPAPDTPAPAQPEPIRVDAPPRPSQPDQAGVEPVTSAHNTPPHAPPSVRRFARQLGVPLAEVSGTGRNGRISKEDIEHFVRSRVDAPPSAPSAIGGGLDLLPWPKPDFAKFGPIERAPLSKIRRVSGANLARNATIIPHVTNFDEADITQLEKFRLLLNKEHGSDAPKITLLPFVIKAAAAALQAFPAFNSSLDGDDLILKKYYNIGFAADTPDGLVVPVIRNAESKGILAIAIEAQRLASEAREGRLKLGDMQGATFTISSLGGIGGTNFTPIINAPEVAILGMTRSAIKPVWDGSAFQPRLIQPISLSWDHRVVDGVAAARFLVLMGRILSDFRHIAI